MTESKKHKGLKFYVRRNIVGAISSVSVSFAGKSWDFKTIKQAKSFINTVVEV